MVAAAKATATTTTFLEAGFSASRRLIIIYDLAIAILKLTVLHIWLEALLLQYFSY